MNIIFSGKWAIDPDTFGVSFEAIVDGVQVRCRVSTEALQDIDSSKATSEPSSQFKSNMFFFQEIAKSLIQKGRTKDGQLFITSADVLA